ncbi:unnamed protein product [Miscanthus lutarioriparius]|uniref:Uncharacterized protein n=1 Tax=Miscanthus lutarioriparius TaxID=422564 RepID=A0A811PKA9_9POAL|nr:unnamed protein product [Miscanthus lutarioriparius]
MDSLLPRARKAAVAVGPPVAMCYWPSPLGSSAPGAVCSLAPPFAGAASLCHLGRCGAPRGERRRWRGLDGGEGVDGCAASAGGGGAARQRGLGGEAARGARAGVVAAAEVRRGPAGRGASVLPAEAVLGSAAWAEARTAAALGVDEGCGGDATREREKVLGFRVATKLGGIGFDP